nr:flavin reductase family protein [Ensifer aridi]
MHTGTIISDGADQPVDADGLKCALRRMSGGVSVITAGKGEDRTGATVTSATALSIEPPCMVVSLNRSSSTWAAVARFGHFCVNVLGHAHEILANQFSAQGGLSGAERYRGAGWTQLISGAPVLRDAAAAIDCVFEEAIERHSHAIVLGRVVGICTGNGGSLVYHDGRYFALPGSATGNSSGVTTPKLNSH